MNIYIVKTVIRFEYLVKMFYFVPQPQANPRLKVCDFLLL